MACTTWACDILVKDKAVSTLYKGVDEDTLLTFVLFFCPGFGLIPPVISFAVYIDMTK